MTRLIDTEEKLKYFVIVNLVGATFLAIWGIQQHFLGNLRLENMASGQFSESNSCATLWVLILPVYFSLFLIGKAKQKMLGVFFSGALLTAIVFTQSRSALFGLLVASSVFFLKSAIKQKVGVVAIAILLIAVFKFASSDVENYDERLASITKKESIAHRLNIWRASRTAFREYPITGVGQQNFQYLAKDYLQRLGLPITFRSRADVHNTPLLILVEGGFICFAFYLFSIWFFFWDIRKLDRHFSKDKDLLKFRPYLTAFQAGIVGFLVSAMAHSYAYFEVYYWFLMFPGLIRNICLHRIESNAGLEKEPLTSTAELDAIS